MATQAQIDKAIEEATSQLSKHRYAGGSVSQEASIEFYKGIIDHCKMAIEGIESDMRNDQDDD